MNRLSKGLKQIYCIIIGVVGFVALPIILTSLVESQGSHSSGGGFLTVLCWVGTWAAIKAIWKYQPSKSAINEEYEPEINEKLTFKDYYEILEVEITATAEEIKTAFKRQAFRWHPDRNAGRDTTQKMQEINEAKLILLNTEARERYNREYIRYKAFQNRTRQQQQTIPLYLDYEVEDNILNNWIRNARIQAVALAKETIRDVKGMTREGTVAASNAIGRRLAGYVILGIILLIVGLIARVFS